MPIAYPYKFSDWYSYDKDCAPRVGKYVYDTAVPKGLFACAQTLTNSSTIWYFPDASPADGDQVYTSATGSGTPSAGKYGYINLADFVGDGEDETDYHFEVNSSGVLTANPSACP